MKKYTHPYYNVSLVISSNGAANYLVSFSNSKFITSSFDSRLVLDKIVTEEVSMDDTSIIFMAEYLHNTEVLWFNEMSSKVFG